MLIHLLSLYDAGTQGQNLVHFAGEA